MTRFEDENMIMISTDYHEGLGQPHQSWVEEWAAKALLSGTANIDDYSGFYKLYMAFPLLTRSGKRTVWHFQAGPLTRAELEELYATEKEDGELHTTCEEDHHAHRD